MTKTTSNTKCVFCLEDIKAELFKTDFCCLDHQIRWTIRDEREA